jgi:hypothetical protein
MQRAQIGRGPEHLTLRRRHVQQPWNVLVFGIATRFRMSSRAVDDSSRSKILPEETHVRYEKYIHRIVDSTMSSAHS